MQSRGQAAAPLPAPLAQSQPSPRQPPLQPPPLLCVSIHDVAPSTWDECARLAAALRSVADIPLSWLVVPRYHDRPEGDTAMRAGLDAALARGDELVLHGYTHLDTEARASGLRQRFLRGVYTQREGEFAALPREDARRRLELGLAWFRERGWRASGFVPPAWLMGQGAWEALHEFGFAYTTTFARFHLLGGAGNVDRARSAEGPDPRFVQPAAPGALVGSHGPHGSEEPGEGWPGPSAGPALFAPSLVYAARNRGGRLLSPIVAGLAARWQAQAPLVRLSSHPPDVRHPRLVRHAQQLIEQLITTRQAVTKETCARLYQPRPQNPPRQPGPQPPYGP